MTIFDSPKIATTRPILTLKRVPMLSRRLIRIKAIKSLYAHLSSGESSLIKSEKEYRQNIKKCYELYILMLGLIAEVAQYAQKRIDIGSAKMRPSEQDKNPNLRFVNNSVVKLLEQSTNLNDAMVREKLNWRGKEQIIKELYNEMIEAPYFKAYMNGTKESFSDDRRMVLDFYKNHLEDNEEFEEAIEEMSIFWSDDINFVLGQIITTIGAIQQNDTDIELQPMYKNDDDREFAEILYRKALVNNAEYFEYIDKLTENWDFERIAIMDRIIMLAAITELTQFPSIPIKVTLDEYIEISKYYSTNSSCTFINGVIDKAIETLTAEGKIAKSGRGLVEN